MYLRGRRCPTTLHPDPEDTRPQGKDLEKKVGGDVGSVTVGWVNGGRGRDVEGLGLGEEGDRPQRRRTLKKDRVTRVGEGSSVWDVWTSV